MTREEVIAIAKSEAEAEGWRWEEPVSVTRSRAFIFFGRVRWHVMTNASYRGCNVNIHIDDATGEILQKGFAPR